MKTEDQMWDEVIREAVRLGVLRDTGRRDENGQIVYQRTGLKFTADGKPIQ